MTINSTNALKLSGLLRPCPSAINPNNARRLLLITPSPFRCCLNSNARRLLLITPSPFRCCSHSSASRFSLIYLSPLPAAKAMTFHTSTSCFLNKMPQDVPFKRRIACVYSYILFSRCLTGKSYDLQFDHNLPVYTLEQMINSGKLQYDYPVYWKKPEDVSKTASSLSRKNKKEKLLKDLSDKIFTLFNSVLKNPQDSSLCTYFCESRLKLVCYIVLQMGRNYESRFFHCEKIFQKYSF